MGKQVSASAAYVKSRWRLGASASSNNAELGDRDMYGVFAGVRTGPVSWLAELDRVTDDVAEGDLDQDVTLLEADWRLAKGHNLKIAYEWHDPDNAASENELERYSFVWEYSPIQLKQVLIGGRAYIGVPAVAATNRDALVAELHVYFGEGAPNRTERGEGRHRPGRSGADFLFAARPTRGMSVPPRRLALVASLLSTRRRRRRCRRCC
jgi:hypothetical protein